jgi:hypothetical protein
MKSKTVEKLMKKIPENIKDQVDNYVHTVLSLKKDKNKTRFYVPLSESKTNEIMIVLSNTLNTFNPPIQMFNEQTKEERFVSGTMDTETGELKLVFDIDKLKKFVEKL